MGSIATQTPYLINERGGNPCLAATTCPPYPVNVVLDLARHVEVNDMLDVGEVQSLRSDIRGDQYILGALLFRCVWEHANND